MNVNNINFQSKLTVSGEKGKGVLGEAELNLSDYIMGEYKSFRIPLTKCVDDEAFIEVALRANDAAKKERRESAKGNG